MRRGGVAARDYVLHVDQGDHLEVEERLVNENGSFVGLLIRVSKTEAHAPSRTSCGRDSTRVNRAGDGSYNAEEICASCLRRRKIAQDEGEERTHPPR